MSVVVVFRVGSGGGSQAQQAFDPIEGGQRTQLRRRTGNHRTVKLLGRLSVEKLGVPAYATGAPKNS